MSPLNYVLSTVHSKPSDSDKLRHKAAANGNPYRSSPQLDSHEEIKCIRHGKKHATDADDGYRPLDIVDEHEVRCVRRYRTPEVLEESEPKQWRYVPTELNPADVLSRGARSDLVNTGSCWFRGSKFLNTNTENEAEEILDTLKHLPISNECNKTDIDVWLACDREDAGFQILNDDGIVTTVSKLHGGPDEEEESYDDEMLQNVCLSYEKAYQCLEVALQWFEMQEECD
ncbi:hypothetical protein M514_02435 [Trichuris suis]|uniref:Uncharacterized protein n=1 Tax=Trichuris suis TaxID=68888 RepID=A0A085N5P2_9BILA|nr:hypothetical protein M513_02435 [Trichuris suis]KFD64788.1 hypothetical protein M514_02435 [Trichuris suis]